MSNLINERATLKQFPKRESVVKNGNPYRFFQSMSKKILI
jgi:hypothetical protein